MWDYPRPPALVPSDRHVVVRFAGEVIAESTRAIRVLETSQAPAWYLPADDVDERCCRPNPQRSTWCEWKGRASYVDLVARDRVSPAAAWRYLDPVPAFAAIAGHYAFYADRVDEAAVDGMVVGANDGDFYGGWITPDVVGPFKGAPGTRGW